VEFHFSWKNSSMFWDCKTFSCNSSSSAGGRLLQFMTRHTLQTKDSAFTSISSATTRSISSSTAPISSSWLSYGLSFAWWHTLLSLQRAEEAVDSKTSRNQTLDTTAAWSNTRATASMLHSKVLPESCKFLSLKFSFSHWLTWENSEANQICPRHQEQSILL